MKEDLLHYLWKFQKLNTLQLFTETKETLQIIKPGYHNQLAGPDFMQAQLEIGGQLWAGQVEIHVKACHWYEHGHQQDPNYDNVILHVVWEHDAEVYRNDSSVIPTLVLKEIVSEEMVLKYESLFRNQVVWIPCESYFHKVDDFVLKHWLDRLYLERLEVQSENIFKELDESRGHWEALLFRMLCKNFGLNINGNSFLSLAKSFEFKMVGKCSKDHLELEALLMGQAGLLANDKEDGYFVQLQQRYAYLKYKFKLENGAVLKPQFFRLRPPNFPTIRLSQLAQLYLERPQLFSEVIAAKSKKDLYELFKISASDYWDGHYNFGVASAARKKWLSEGFRDLIIINTIIPIKFCYAKYLDKEIADEILELASEVKSEQNAVVKKFNGLKKISKSAVDSQGLLQLKKNYCDRQKCLNCAVGDWYLKRG